MAQLKTCRLCGTKETVPPDNVPPSELVKITGYSCSRCGDWFCPNCSVVMEKTAEGGSIKKSCPVCDRGMTPPPDDDMHFTGKNKDLFEAIQQNKIARFRSLLSKGVNINSQEKNSGMTMLIYAARRNNLDVVRLLVEKQADMSLADSNGKTALMWAVVEGYAQMVDLLLKRAAPMDSRDKEGRTPLIWATVSVNKEIVQLLIRNRAEVNAPDTAGQTPIFFCVKNNDEERRSLLLEQGRIKSETDAITPFANDNPSRRAELLKVLIAAGANVNQVDRNGNSAFTFAMENDKTELAKILLEAGAEVEAPTDGGLTLLMRAVYAHYKNIAKLLVDNGANVDAGDREGNTGLILTAAKGYFDEAKMLVEMGADVNARNIHGRSALSFAVEQCRYDVAELLLESGADAREIDANGLTLPWMLMEDSVIKPEAPRMIKLLLDKGADVDAKNNRGQSLLMQAIMSKSPQLALALLDYRPDINTRNQYDESALMYASLRGYIDVVKKLLENGADLDATNKKHKTAVDYAVKGRHTKVIELLEQAGAQKKGCYIATCVYGGNAWQTTRLRQWRDTSLNNSWVGRGLVHHYYSVSPALVKMMGHNIWFIKICRTILDKLLTRLR